VSKKETMQAGSGKCGEMQVVQEAKGRKAAVQGEAERHVQVRCGCLGSGGCAEGRGQNNRIPMSRPVHDCCPAHHIAVASCTTPPLSRVEARPVMQAEKERIRGGRGRCLAGRHHVQV